MCAKCAARIRPLARGWCRGETYIGGGAVDASWVVAQRARGDAAARACSDSEARERLYDVLCGPFPSLAGRAVLSGQNFSAGSKAV